MQTLLRFSWNAPSCTWRDGTMEQRLGMLRPPMETGKQNRYYWKRTNSLIGDSTSTVVWDIPPTAKSGIYRIRHFGSSKNILQILKPYTGTSREFEVVP
ncbi:UNVERIFIED_CONTAM: inactive neutral ceramidase B [Trichonephila clavipes]